MRGRGGEGMVNTRSWRCRAGATRCLRALLVPFALGLILGVPAQVGPFGRTAEAHSTRYAYCQPGDYYENWSNSIGSGVVESQLHYTIAGNGLCSWKAYWQEYSIALAVSYAQGTTLYNGGNTIFDNNGSFCIQPPSNTWSSPYYFSQNTTTSAQVRDSTNWSQGGPCGQGGGGGPVDYYPYNQP